MGYVNEAHLVMHPHGQWHPLLYQGSKFSSVVPLPECTHRSPRDALEFLEMWWETEAITT